MKEENEDKEMQRLRELWQHSDNPLRQADAPLPLERVKELAQRLPQPGNEARRREARRLLAMALPASLLCLLPAGMAGLHGMPLTAAAALLLALAAGTQTVAEGRYLWLLRHDDTTRYPHTVAVRYAQRLLKTETRRLRRRQRLARYVRPEQQPAFRYCANGIVLACCVLILWSGIGGGGTTITALADGSSYISLQCSYGNCATQACNDILNILYAGA